MTRRWVGAVVAGLLATAASAEVVDGCASPLGSLGVELRYARQLPRGARTTFSCPRDTAVLVGISRPRVLAALGTPDETQAASWSYWFGPAPGTDAERTSGQPGLRFEFGDDLAVTAVTCLRHP